MSSCCQTCLLDGGVACQLSPSNFCSNTDFGRSNPLFSLCIYGRLHSINLTTRNCCDHCRISGCQGSARELPVERDRRPYRHAQQLVSELLVEPHPRTLLSYSVALNGEYRYAEGSANTKNNRITCESPHGARLLRHRILSTMPRSKVNSVGENRRIPVATIWVEESPLKHETENCCHQVSVRTGDRDCSVVKYAVPRSWT